MISSCAQRALVDERVEGAAEIERRTGERDVSGRAVGRNTGRGAPPFIRAAV